MSTVSASPSQSPAPTQTPRAVSVRIAAYDGVPQVFVPAGEFRLGSTSAGPLAYGDEMPRHLVLLGA